jgi:ribosomal protein L11 methyltransferase
MSLCKLRIEAADLETGRALAQRLEEAGDPAALAVTLFEARPPRFVVEAYYDPAPPMAGIAAALAGIAGVGQPQLEAVPDQNWVAVSQASLPPVAAGRFIVHGSHDRARCATRRLAVEIEAGEAFGTGYNATTALCLEALDELTKRRRFARVLDLGCGSGVLGIAAARALPAARVLAVDDDRRAAAIARENARVNRVAARVRVLAAAGFGHPALRRPQRFDLVLANLLPGPLIALAPGMRRAIRPCGVAVLSGVLDHQAGEVAAAYRSIGFHLLRRLRRAGWTALVLARRLDPCHPAMPKAGCRPVRCRDLAFTCVRRLMTGAPAQRRMTPCTQPRSRSSRAGCAKRTATGPPRRPRRRPWFAKGRATRSRPIPGGASRQPCS